VSRLAWTGVNSGHRSVPGAEIHRGRRQQGSITGRSISAANPSLTCRLSLAGTRKDAGVSIAEVNLKLIWDVVSQIKVGEKGHAYVVGSQGPADCASGYSLVAA